jgi:GDPmannose 4,6-dehydratase
VINDNIVIVEIDEKYYRPSEVDILLGDYTKAKTILNWHPKTKFNDLVKLMMKNDLEYDNNKN